MLAVVLGVDERLYFVGITMVERVRRDEPGLGVEIESAARPVGRCWRALLRHVVIGAAGAEVHPRRSSEVVRAICTGVADAVVVEDKAVLHVIAYVKLFEVRVVPILDACGGR